MIPLIVASCALIFAFLAAIFAYSATKRALVAESYCVRQNTRAKIAAVEAEMTEILDSIDAIRESNKKLRSRIGMRALRERKKAEVTPEYPNTPEGRDAERAALEKELAESGRLNARIHQQGAK